MRTAWEFGSSPLRREWVSAATRPDKNPGQLRSFVISSAGCAVSPAISSKQTSLGGERPPEALSISPQRRNFSLARRRNFLRHGDSPFPSRAPRRHLPVFCPARGGFISQCFRAVCTSTHSRVYRTPPAESLVWDPPQWRSVVLSQDPRSFCHQPASETVARVVEHGSRYNDDYTYWEVRLSKESTPA
ncbi:hypothetical protein PR048_014664 [Dryococelus australis]|uniref:Uncharacterized protein n=1 Tax=Dryococelus australis TaxID=614101 RepID=A0ABQ9HF38_9NEOP|nr:hypothetical protein PR048_014664 [Dryococelus australis]